MSDLGIALVNKGTSENVCVPTENGRRGTVRERCGRRHGRGHRAVEERHGWWYTHVSSAVRVPPLKKPSSHKQNKTHMRRRMRRKKKGNV